MISRTPVIGILMLIFSACNKKLPDADPIIFTHNGTQTIGEAINSDTSYSFFKAAATKVGALTTLLDSNTSYTLFLPDNNAFRASGIPSLAVVNGLPVATIGGIVNYAIVPGAKYKSTDIPTTFPNFQLPTAITIGQLPGTILPFKLTTFPSRRAAGFWDNNIPVVKPDLEFKNGIIHVMAAIVAPPSKVLKDALYSNPNLTYFKAAVQRADSGQTGLNRFDSLLNYAVTNMTVLAPNDAAFQTLIFGLVFKGYLSSRPTPYTATDTAIAFATANGAVAAGPVFLSTNNVSTATVRGIIANHLLASPNPLTSAYEPNIRVFSVNFPPASAAPFFVKTLVNAAVPVHPGIIVNAIFTGPFVTDLKFIGLGTFPPGGAPYSGAPATAVSKDNHAVNGVYHVIDKVLLPQ